MRLSDKIRMGAEEARQATVARVSVQRPDRARGASRRMMTDHLTMSREVFFEHYTAQCMDFPPDEDGGES